MKYYYTYALKSLKDGKLYIGWSNDLKKRLGDHNEGKVTATKFRRPLVLVYFEACLSKESAVRREKSLKTGFGRRYLNDRIG